MRPRSETAGYVPTPACSHRRVCQTPAPHSSGCPQQAAVPTCRQVTQLTALPGGLCECPGAVGSDSASGGLAVELPVTHHPACALHPRVMCWAGF